MDINEYVKKLDELFATGRVNEVEEYLLNGIRDGKSRGDTSLLLLAHNELVGYYRSVGKFDEALSHADCALKILKDNGLYGTLHYATTLLNTATAMRGKKMYEDSLRLYQEALDIFENQLDENDYRIAGLYNNMSIVHENMGELQKAKDCLLRAIDIIRKNPEAFVELATSYVNLAQIEFSLGEDEKAQQDTDTALGIFEDHNATKDMHYSAALATAALSCYRKKDYDSSIRYYEAALDTLESVVGKNDYYYVLLDNLEEVKNAKRRSET